ncbi:MAG: IS1096 element passenger TnpR family protein [Bacteroidota bacterium]
MAVYKFRVHFEEYDDVYRDIEIKSSQTFKEFHEAIQQSINFDNKHAASFFVSDTYWRKGTEITLLKEDLEDGVKLMEKTKIAACVEDPHQRFVYVYDKVATWSFNIELIKINKDESGKFPACVKSNGTAPKQYKPIAEPKKEVPLSKEAGLAALLQNMKEDEEDEAYHSAKEETEEILDEEEARGVMGTDNNEGEEENEFGENEENEEGDNEDEGENYGRYDEDER